MSMKGSPSGGDLYPGIGFFTRYREYILLALLIACIALAVYINYVYGVETVYTHFFYLPIILAALWYHKKAVYLALFFALLHILLGVSATGAIVSSTLVRATSFLAVALVVGTLSGTRDRLFAEVRTSEAELRSIFNGVSDAIFIHDFEGRIIDVNQRMLELFGVSRDEAVRLSIEKDYSSPENPLDWVREAWAKAIAGEDPVFEWVARKPHDGSTFQVEVYLRKISLRGQDVILATVRDITKRKQFEAERTRLAIDLRRLLESTGEGIYGIDLQDHCSFLNRSASVMLGYAPEELIGRDIHWAIHGRYPDGTPLPKEACRIINSMKTGEGVRASDEVFWRKDGTSFPVEYSSNPIREKGAIVGAVVTFFDITARKRTDQELQEARKRAELFVDLLGHDINNLNQLGIGYLEVALGSLKLEEEGTNILQRALEAMKNSSRLIENVRKIQQIEANEARQEIVDLGQMLSEVTAEFSEVPGREVSIVYQPATACCVNASVLIREAFRNLVSNAIKHSSGPITVWIKVFRTTAGEIPYYRVDIEDNGPGIPDELKQKLFSRKVRGTSGTAGSGLGLFLVRTLVEHSGGRVWVEDRVPGDITKGSRFVVQLPAYLP